MGISSRSTEEHLEAGPSVPTRDSMVESTYPQKRFVVELYPAIPVRIDLLERFCERLDDDAATYESIEGDGGRWAPTASRICTCFTKDIVTLFHQRHGSIGPTVFNHDELQEFPGEVVTKSLKRRI